MPEMGVAVPATNFGAHHAVRGVRQVADRIIADRLVKLGQPQPESYFVWELNSGASHTAVVDAFPFIVQQTPGKRRFCAVILRHVKLHLCKVFSNRRGYVGSTYAYISLLKQTSFNPDSNKTLTPARALLF